MAILDFSVPGWHGFGSVIQVCFRISVSNFMCMSFVAVGRNLTIVSYVAFKMAAFWFWTMFNCNPPIAHCHPLLWGGGILVDHWSTISISTRFYYHLVIPYVNNDLSSITALETHLSGICTQIINIFILRKREIKHFSPFVLSTLGQRDTIPRNMYIICFSFPMHFGTGWF